MNILREELIENLSKCFSKLCDDRKTMQLISEVMHNKRNYLPASTFSIVFQQRPLTDLSDNELKSTKLVIPHLNMTTPGA